MKVILPLCLCLHCADQVGGWRGVRRKNFKTPTFCLTVGGLAVTLLQTVTPGRG